MRQPDPEALEDDELQYGHGPISTEELEARYSLSPALRHALLTRHQLPKPSTQHPQDSAVSRITYWLV